MLADLDSVRNGTVTEDMLLGVVAMFSVPDQPVQADRLRRVWGAEGLDLDLVPETRKPVDVFQTACKSVESRGKSGLARDVEIKVDCVSETPTHCVYQITRMVRDKAANVIDHPKAMRLTFDKRLEGIDVDFFSQDPVDQQALTPLVSTITDRYTNGLGTVPGNKVRTAVRTSILNEHATNLRGRAGGVYFVPKAGIATLEKIQSVLSYLYDTAASLDMIPWLNTESAREIVANHHATHVREECEEMVGKLAERLQKPSKPRSDFIAGVISTRRGLAKRAREYRTLLEGETEGIEAALELLDEQLDRLMARSAGIEEEATA